MPRGRLIGTACNDEEELVEDAEVVTVSDEEAAKYSVIGVHARIKAFISSAVLEFLVNPFG